MSKKHHSILIDGDKYQIRQSTSDRFIATSLKGTGHIIGVKAHERRIFVLIEPDGIIPFTTSELVKILGKFAFNNPYKDEETKLSIKNQVSGKFSSPLVNKNRNKTKGENNPQDKEDEISFTARLMAYYRAQELKRKKPIIIDLFSERLAGNLSSFMDSHVRYSEMDYPIVRSYFIEKNLLTPWCISRTKSQIILLGAGLDTRAYRFKPFKINSHTIFEVDFPNIIKYKEDILHDEKSFCNLIRLPLDLSNSEWTSMLLKKGYSVDLPTFWILEGLVYYLGKDNASSLIAKTAEMSSKKSQIFVDIMHQSRWFPTVNGLYNKTNDPILKHLKWGLDIKLVPSFFTNIGWDVSCSYADDYDQGRNVGQKAMIFIHGIRI